MGLTALFVFFLTILFWIIYNEKSSTWRSNFPEVIPFALFFAFVFSFVGGALGRIVFDLKNVKQGAFAGLLAFLGMFCCYFMLIVLFGEFAPSLVLLLIQLAVVFAVMGALVGGIVAIHKRTRIEPESRSILPRFYLRELLVGFSLMAVILAFFINFIRQLP
jgi:uncharacterized protein involved in response to NO